MSDVIGSTVPIWKDCPCNSCSEHEDNVCSGYRNQRDTKTCEVFQKWFITSEFKASLEKEKDTTISIVWNKDNIFIDSNEEEACRLIVPLADSFIQVCLHAKRSLTDMQEFISLRHDKAIFHLEDNKEV